MSFWKNFKPKACNIALEGEDKEAVLREIVDGMVSGGALAREFEKPALTALMQREEQATTGVGMSVAIPHVQIVGLQTAAVTLCVHKGGVSWEAVDGEAVHLFFTVLRPEKSGPRHDPQKHLEMMRWIARLGRSADFRRFALLARNRTELCDLLKEMANV